MTVIGAYAKTQKHQLLLFDSFFKFLIDSYVRKTFALPNNK